MDNYVTLETYGSYDSLNNIEFGLIFKVSEKWFLKYIENTKFKSIEEFLDNYTYDDTLGLDELAKKDGALISKVCGLFGREINT